MVTNGSVSLGVRKMLQEQSMINFMIVGIKKTIDLYTLGKLYKYVNTISIKLLFQKGLTNLKASDPHGKHWKLIYFIASTPFLETKTVGFCREQISHWFNQYI